MNPATLTILVIVGILLVGLLAFGVYKAGFRVKGGKIKTPVAEFDLERTPGDAEEAAETGTPPPARTEAEILAREGGQVEDGSISAPADSGARAAIKASGKESQVKKGKIKLD